MTDKMDAQEAIEEIMRYHYHDIASSEGKNLQKYLAECGFVIVPIEPTEEQLSAALYYVTLGKMSATECYQAMIQSYMNRDK